jgi:hypothetical protein
VGSDDKMENVDDEDTVCNNNSRNNNNNSSSPVSNNNNNLNSRRLSLADIMITKIRKNSNPDYLSGSDELRGDKKDIKIDIPYMTAEKFADKRVKVSTGTFFVYVSVCVRMINWFRFVFLLFVSHSPCSFFYFAWK